MSDRLTALAQKKQRLLVRSADLRDRMGTHAEGLAPLFRAADRLREAGAVLRRHPEWVVGAVVLVVVARPRFVWRWAQRGFVGWRMWKSVRQLLPARTAHLREPH